MFTGIIEDIGTLDEINVVGGQAKLSIKTGLSLDDFVLGESVAVNGICLTVSRYGEGFFEADVSPETLKITTLGDMYRGSRVNLERALRLSDRLGGHLVTGHVDGSAKLLNRRKESNAWHFVFETDPSITGLMVNKGSVAVDGISLTINALSESSFTVTIVPHTLRQTTLSERSVGDRVNIETDIIGKYVTRLLGNKRLDHQQGVTLDLLAKHGFL